MGASVSICNLTAVIINISLKQVSPLYYENKVLPDNCVTFQTGRVWFTVEGRIWTNGSNDYNEAQKILPAAGLGLLVPPLVAGVAGAILESSPPATPPPSNGSFGNMSATMTVSSHPKIVAGSMIATLPGGAITAAGAIVNMDHTPLDWSVSKSGVYMRAVTKIQITGGPSAGNVTISRQKKWQKIRVDSFDPLRIEVKQ